MPCNWLTGNFKVIATLRVSTSLVAAKLMLPQATGIEPGLGEWVGFGGTLDSGAIVELIRYSESPNPQDFELRVDAHIDKESASTVLHEVVDTLGIAGEEITWRLSSSDA